MKTAKKLTALSLALILILAFSACGASKETAQDSATISEPEMASPQESTSFASGSDSVFGTAANSKPTSQNTEKGKNGAAEPASVTEKIIYSGSAQIETMEFDKTLSDLMKLLDKSGGFVQSSYVTGKDFNASYYGGKSYRSAEYCLRIPAEKFKQMTDELDALGNVPYSSINAENVTVAYQDNESRLSSRKTEETRLIELLARAGTVEDMLQIEKRLSEVRYEIESLESSLTNLDNQISYSTLNLTVTEVTLYTEDSPATIGYGERLRESFVHSLKSVGRFFKDFFVLLVAALPVIVVAAAVIVPIVLIIRHFVQKKRSMKKNQD